MLGTLAPCDSAACIRDWESGGPEDTGVSLGEGAGAGALQAWCSCCGRVTPLCRPVVTLLENNVSALWSPREGDQPWLSVLLGIERAWGDPFPGKAL